MNKIVKRVYYAIEIELASPLSISNGIGNETDSDLLKTPEGNVFIPGSSIAGAIRNKIDPDLRGTITGYSEDKDGRMSNLFVSDLCFERGIESVRDGVLLNSEKTVDNKFDFEVLETNAGGTLFINYLIREKDKRRMEDAETSEDIENVFTQNIAALLNGIADGQIRFGANKNRGYGRFKVKAIRTKAFDCTNRREYINFKPRDLALYDKPEDYKEWANKNRARLDHYCKVIAPLRLTGGISIRKYSARPNEADYMQITIGRDGSADNRPVIPGTSWNGAIRADALNILKELGVTDADKHINQWFGHVQKKGLDSETARESAIVIGESIIDGSVPLTMTRNKVNRFDASTQDGALYTEISYFGGNTNLEIMVKKSVNYKAVLGLLLLVIKDIENGYIAIGGQTAVGRGIFESNGAVRFSEAIKEDECRKTLFQYIQEGR